MSNKNEFKKVERSAANWARFEEGASWQGILMGKRNRSDGDGVYYQLRLTESGMAVSGKGESPKKVPAGTIVNIDEKAFLRDLEKFLDDGKTHEVLITVGDKVKLDNGHTAWQGEISERIADDIPF